MSSFFSRSRGRPAGKYPKDHLKNLVVMLEVLEQEEENPKFFGEFVADLTLEGLHLKRRTLVRSKMARFFAPASLVSERWDIRFDQCKEWKITKMIRGPDSQIDVGTLEFRLINSDSFPTWISVNNKEQVKFRIVDSRNYDMIFGFARRHDPAANNFGEPAEGCGEVAVRTASGPAEANNSTSLVAKTDETENNNAARHSSGNQQDCEVAIEPPKKVQEKNLIHLGDPPCDKASKPFLVSSEDVYRESWRLLDNCDAAMIRVLSAVNTKVLFDVINECRGSEAVDAMEMYLQEYCRAKDFKSMDEPLVDLPCLINTEGGYYRGILESVFTLPNGKEFCTARYVDVAGEFNGPTSVVKLLPAELLHDPPLVYWGESVGLREYHGELKFPFCAVVRLETKPDGVIVHFEYNELVKIRSAQIAKENKNKDIHGIGRLKTLRTHLKRCLGSFSASKAINKSILKLLAEAWLDQTTNPWDYGSDEPEVF